MSKDKKKEEESGKEDKKEGERRKKEKKEEERSKEEKKEEEMREQEKKEEEMNEEEKKEEERSEETNEDWLREVASPTASSEEPEPLNKPTITEIPEVVDDFLRNFLRRMGMTQTLNSFEKEWYGSARGLQMEIVGMTTAGNSFIPDALTHQQLLLRKLEEMRRETELLQEQVLQARERQNRMQREKEFHRTQYSRVLEEKNNLNDDVKQLRRHLEMYKPVLKQLDDKYHAALGQKMLLTLERDRVKNTSNTRTKQEKIKNGKDRSVKKSRHAYTTTLSRLLKFSGPQPDQVGAETFKSSFSLSCSIRAHKLSISCIHLHPHKWILASASSDRSWRLWALPTTGEKVGEMLLTGEGHSDWLSGCCFHPDGGKLATTSGDTTVRLWDFSRGRCVSTLSGHTRPTRSCSFHSCGHFLVSCSEDKNAKLWDLSTASCCLTLRKHTAAITAVSYLPSSDLILTCSADKTLAVWDARVGICTATFQGHQQPCNHVTFNLARNITASCDTGGTVNLWDIRKPSSPTAKVDTGPMAANQVAFSSSGKVLAVASDDGLVKMVAVDSLDISSLAGHRDSVQSVAFDHKGETVVSADSNGFINVWS